MWRNHIFYYYYFFFLEFMMSYKMACIRNIVKNKRRKIINNFMSIKNAYNINIIINSKKKKD